MLMQQQFRSAMDDDESVTASPTAGLCKARTRPLPVVSALISSAVLVMLLSTPACQCQQSVEVICYPVLECVNTTASILTSSIAECCLGDGVTYKTTGGGSCNRCIVYGFMMNGLPVGNELLVEERGTESYNLDYGPVKPPDSTFAPSVVILVQVMDGSAKSGIDYRSSGTSAGTSVSLFILKDNTALEGNESFTVEVSGTPLEPPIIYSNLTVTILDKDVVMLQFAQADATITEGESLSLQLVLNGKKISIPLSVLVTPLTYQQQEAMNLTLPDDFPDKPTPAGLEDFGSGSQLVTFEPSASTRQEQPVVTTTVDDTVNEPAEGYIVYLMLEDAGVSPYVDTHMRTAVLVKIADNDFVTIGFEQNIYLYREGGEAPVINLIREGGTLSEQTFIVMVIAEAEAGGREGVVALAGEDYILWNSTVEFPSSAQSVQVPLQLLDDLAPENDEAFVLRVSQSGTGPTFTSGPPALISIHDNDGVPPLVTSEPEDTKVYLGDPVMLFCGIMGLPTPAIQWYQDAEPLPNATSPSLTIQAAQPDDRGYYTCIGSNSHGNASSRPTIVSLYGVIQYIVHYAFPPESSEELSPQIVATNLTGGVIADPFAAILSAHSLGKENNSDEDVASILLTLHLSNDSSLINLAGLRKAIAELMRTLLKNEGSTGAITIQRYDGCDPKKVLIMEAVFILLPEADIGGEVTLDCPCFPSSYNLHAYQACQGTFTDGGMWGEPLQSECSLEGISLEVCEASQLESPQEAAEQLSIVTASPEDLDPLDVSIAAEALPGLLEEAATDRNVLSSFLETCNNLLSVSEDVLLESQNRTKSSKLILGVLNELADTLELNASELSITYQMNQLFFHVQEATVHQYSGVVFSVSSLQNESDLTNATFLASSGDGSTQEASASIALPVSLVKDVVEQAGMHANLSTLRLTSLVFADDRAFQSREEYKVKEGAANFTLGGRLVLSASVSGHRVEQLTQPVVVQFEKSYEAMGIEANTTCVFWDFSLDGGYGGWSEEGCYLSTEDHSTATCHCSHLTSFAILLDVSPQANVTIDPLQTLTISIITYVGIGVSTICLVATIVTILMTKKHRRSDQLLLNMCVALGCLYLSFVLSSLLTSNTHVCLAASAILHYCMLAYFFWTAAEAGMLYFKFVRVMKTKSVLHHYTFKAMFICWVCPVLVVGVSLIGYREYGDENFCRPYGFPFYLGILLPFAAVYIFNWTVFTVIMIALCQHSSKTAETKTGKTSNTGWKLLVIAFILSVLFGLGWGFGLLGTTALPKTVFVLAQYLFSIFIGLQGLMIFVLHCVRSPDAREEWIHWWYLATCREGEYKRRRALSFSTTNRKVNSSSSRGKSHMVNTDQFSLDSKELSSSVSVLEEKKVEISKANGREINP